MADTLKQAAEKAADVLDEARSYVGSESWSPSMLEECERALRMLRAALAAVPAQPVARLLTWCGPAHISIPHGGIAARTYAEFPESSAAPQDPDAYWRNGAALYAAPQAVPVPAWQPIETAPKDGSLFLCWVAAKRWSSPDGECSSHDHDTSQADFCSWRNGPSDLPEHGYFDPCCGQIGDSQDVTHWMPLLPAPGAAQAAQPALSTAPNLACKSVQARLAEQWGYVRAQPAPQPLTSEHHFALREAHAIGASDAYFKAWPTHDNDAGRMLFERGFVRGFDCHDRIAAAGITAAPTTDKKE